MACTSENLGKSWNVQYTYLHLRHDSLFDVIMQQPAEAVLGGYVETLRDHHKQLMARKLGVKELDEKLQQGFMVAMFETKADFTNSFRALASVMGSQADDDFPEALQQVRARPCSRTFQVRGVGWAWGRTHHETFWRLSIQFGR